MINLHVADDWKDYELMDSGAGRKLERWGSVVTIRPEPRAIWQKSDNDIWEGADGIFSENGWKFEEHVPNSWQIAYRNIKFALKPTEFKHTGVFPEQAVNWKWMDEKLKNKTANVLNLFAYTGGATMTAAANPDVHVTHVDASRPSMMWASENAKLSRISPDHIRWIQDDCLKFVKREINRGMKYDGIIMDPPKFGRGMKGEVWKLLEDLPHLANECKRIMSDTPLFFLINAYAADMSSLVLENLLSGISKDWGGKLESGELGLKESAGGRILPAGIFARWSLN